MAKPNNTNYFQGGGVDENPLCAMVLDSMKKFRKNLGFTLAEVLITLGIIGIVAAMVIPSLINRYQKIVTLSRLKQTYAQITQAVKLSEDDNGDLTSWNMGTSTTATYPASEKLTKQYFLPYLNYSYICNNNQSYCTSHTNHNLYGIEPNNSWRKLYGIVLKNGVELIFSPEKAFTTIYVDINGSSSPNIRGKDIFFIILKGYGKTADVRIDDPGVFFAGEGFTRKQLTKTGTRSGGRLCAKTGEAYNGAHCGALIKLDGWKISKDYPW